MNDANTASKRFRTAMAIALCADAIQIIFSPMLAVGFANPLDDILDLVVCVALTLLLGWHYAFLPSFLIKVVPFADIVPSWTIAVLLARRSQKKDQVIDVTAITQPPPLENKEIPAKLKS